VQPKLYLSRARVLVESEVVAKRHGNLQRDYRAALCRWEDDLFGEFKRGHEILEYQEAFRLLDEAFRAFGRKVPKLRMVPGFADPKVGGFADVERHCIYIETGFLYRFLILHEAAHILVPGDLNHGAAFIYVLQFLYRDFIGIPEHAIRSFLQRHELPCATGSAIPETSMGVAARCQFLAGCEELEGDRIPA
jgi:hypothetical protein